MKRSSEFGVYAANASNATLGSGLKHPETVAGRSLFNPVRDGQFQLKDFNFNGTAMHAHI